MSNAYITAPPTQGKVILHTTAGPFEIELWAKETPKTCRNFIQLCLEGYYDGTIFHRAVKDFIVQGGDPTGTGHGGESIYGEPFDDEFHSRLRFAHRGLLGMANTGANENGSQFFFTLDRTDELNRKNTLFGRIVGDTLFNLLKFNDLECDADERPLYPPKVIRAEVLSNPFSDLVPRITPEERAALAQAEKQRKEAEETAKKPKGKKNLKLLSFGEDAVEETSPDSIPKFKSKSSHDLLSDDPRLSKEVAIDLPKQEISVGLDQLRAPKAKVRLHAAVDDEQDALEGNDADYDRRMRDRVRKRVKMASDAAAATLPVQETKLSGLQSEIAKVRSEIRSIGAKEEEEPVQKPAKKEKLLDALRAGYVSAKSKKVKGGESDTLELLKRFQSKLRAPPAPPPSTTSKAAVDPDPAGQKECDLHFVVECESCRDTFGAGDEHVDETGWMASKLVFEKRKAANVYDYSVEDPRDGAKKADFVGAGMEHKIEAAKETWRDSRHHHPRDRDRYERGERPGNRSAGARSTDNQHRSRPAAHGGDRLRRSPMWAIEMHIGPARHFLKPTSTDFSTKIPTQDIYDLLRGVAER
ncbi:Peptidyl-prolyl isomerase cwc27 [Geranomyces variabilis]|uniref:Peptidyl-prolyl isomerase CWC27 n=1 Tax=Geranomyces variabilis TaxID=109894 RepID=A0AAD5XNF7_9FUNG|nr:Peptidyl-prolyl isomerase cwc27 [Geranomyces variabilis]